MKTLLTKFKGYLTNTSALILVGDVLAVKNDIIPSFNDAANSDFSIIGLVSWIGFAVGLIRKTTAAYKEATK